MPHERQPRPHRPPPTYPSLRAAALPLFALCLAFFVEMVDNTLLTIALPTIGRDLGQRHHRPSVGYRRLLAHLRRPAADRRLGRRPARPPPRPARRALPPSASDQPGVVFVSTAGELIALRAALGVAAAAMAPVTISLVFRLFDDETLRMRAITVMIVVGMSGFVLGPLLGGTALAHVSWEWLLVVNAPIALIAWIGVRLGVPPTDAEDLTADRSTCPAPSSASPRSVSPATPSPAASSTAGSHRSPACAPSARSLAVVAFVRHERSAASPDARPAPVLRSGPARGAAIAQIGTSIAMAGVMFGLILHFQYAYGWSPMRAGLANLPLILTMIAATPIVGVAGRAVRPPDRLPRSAPRSWWSHCSGMAWGVEHGYLAIAVSMVVFTIGLRTIMTICAVALVDGHAGEPHLDRRGAQRHGPGGRHQRRHGSGRHHDRRPGHHGAAAGVWSTELVQSFFHGERVTFLVLAAIVGLVATFGSLSLTDSRSTEEH